MAYGLVCGFIQAEASLTNCILTRDKNFQISSQAKIAGIRPVSRIPLSDKSKRKLICKKPFLYYYYQDKTMELWNFAIWRLVRAKLVKKHFLPDSGFFVAIDSGLLSYSYCLSTKILTAMPNINEYF